jgi:beta-galactosidase GanA
VNGKYIGKLDRREGIFTIELPKTDVKNPILEIFVEGMGHINFAQQIIDRKGITDRVSLNGMTLMNWEVYKLPMDESYLSKLNPSENFEKPGIFFKGNFNLDQVADTYIDMKNYTKGVVWVNGHNLGRYWNIGPQFGLFCPAIWLKKGENEIYIFDIHQLEAKPVKGVKVLE